MLLCVHGKPFEQMVVTNNERRNEEICCLHCNTMKEGNVWYAQCCVNPFSGWYHDVSILNDPSVYCMLCHDCLFKVGHLSKLSKENYHKEFLFYDQYGNEM